MNQFLLQLGLYSYVSRVTLRRCNCLLCDSSCLDRAIHQSCRPSRPTSPCLRQ